MQAKGVGGHEVELRDGIQLEIENVDEPVIEENKVKGELL